MPSPELPAVDTPASKKTMAKAAPNAAPCETPSVEDEARGLRSTFCMTHPARLKAAPTTTAAVSLGRRIEKRIVRVAESAFPVSVASKSLNVTPVAPEQSDSTIAAMSATASQTSRQAKVATCRR